MAELRITNVSFEADALIVSFIELPTDVRVEGKVAIQRQIQMSLDHPDYSADSDLLHAQAVRAVKNALEDWTTSEPYHPETDPDDEKGMGE